MQDGPWNKYDPCGYKNAFRRIATRLRERETDNVAFVWHAATNVFTNGADICQWWPGSDVVDWIGMSFFTFHCPSWASLARMAHENKKPVIICEAAPQGFDIVNLTQGSVSGNGSDRCNVSEDDVWNNWFEHFFSFIENERGVVRAISVSHDLCSRFRSDFEFRALPLGTHMELQADKWQSLRTDFDGCVLLFLFRPLDIWYQYINCPWNDQPMWNDGSQGYWGDSRISSAPRNIQKKFKQRISQLCLPAVGDVRAQLR